MSELLQTAETWDDEEAAALLASRPSGWLQAALQVDVSAGVADANDGQAGWRWLWCVLGPGSFTCYADEEEVERVCRIYLHPTTRVQAGPGNQASSAPAAFELVEVAQANGMSDFPTCRTVVGSGKVYRHFDAGDDEALKAWMSAILAVIDHLQQLTEDTEEAAAASRAGNGFEAWIDDFSDYEGDGDESQDPCECSLSIERVDETDWATVETKVSGTVGGGDEVASTADGEEIIVPKSGLSPNLFEIDDFSDYEGTDDEGGKPNAARTAVQKAGDLVALETLDWTAAVHFEES
eukprot:TRINITY_DN33855_c0_g1_i2.p1 TRINITY_DN33855_c0_g1~~TRINITY_DN33855_c0_g1_i2.p1  ORF type:complete len:305 (+),score=77.19 TRINITY_DN33855_c0_g1_i2:34-915(+)